MSPVFGHGRLRLYLLKLLDESPRHGYDVIRLLEDRFMGLYSPSAGTVYPRLARLETEGLVTHAEQEGRKVYRITEPGRAELAARRGELDDLEQEIAGSVRDLRAELKAAARDVRRQGRHEARAAQHTTHPGRAELERLTDWFRTEMRDVIRRSTPTTEELASVRYVLDVALEEVRRVVGRADDGRGTS